MSASASSSTYAAAIAQVETLANLSVALQRALSDPAVLFYGAIIVAARSKLVSITSSTSGSDSLLTHVNALLEVVQLLSVGTWSSLSSLSEAATKHVDVVVKSKLRQLTVLSVSHAQLTRQVTTNDNEADSTITNSQLQKDEVSYHSLATALGIDLEAPTGLRFLEDTLLDALSNGLFAGKLNRKQQTLWIRHGEMESRDVVSNPIAAASAFKGILANWLTRCDAQLASLDLQHAKMLQSVAQQNDREAILASRQVNAMERAKEDILAASLRRERDVDSVMMGMMMDGSNRRNFQQGGRMSGHSGGKRRDY
ncbi:Hypothetical protein, putative [Bodo saltans]|uniref:PCI domain-containing protein n=1 Tax=Bodo saltans TaxID=75058 RepID=A0A0S4JC20_BODSA|nr:Hypothetical protein, putative [Bodo saltans]|eukprot:CUG87543.1 Hypothetical protein, putative [Bodo saltans]